ncbi:cyclic nucleotide-binding/CBS domain-containing protein [Falsiroseomonas sp.]|uniref:CBS domain-containing protein n=1 Tax=Falsiroseomonas sp. TaxID=2870721 RepID=UPI0027332A9F|nr:CBS domain-containing protein [Falsiroseomonas sp.]MDP3418397.1 CBS domain-containing protein [Falsiroseomonas sp.]
MAQFAPPLPTQPPIQQAEPVTLSPGDSVAEACHAMQRHGTTAVLIVGVGERLLGIFTGRDAVRCLAEGCDPQQTRVEWEMTRSPVTIPPDLPMQEALRVFEAAGVRHLPVCVDGRPRGVLRRGAGTRPAFPPEPKLP